MVRTTLGLAIALSTVSSVALADNHCADGLTITDGVLTVATGNPAYFPWVIADDPESGEGYEAAVAYAIADAMGFGADEVVWVRTTFDQAIQPGTKDFDLNMQQYSITAERDQTIDFSAPYYTASAAVLVRQPTVDAGAEPTLESLASLRWGAAAGTTALGLISELIGPSDDVYLYDDVADVTEALRSNQIDATLNDLPTALYVAAVLLEDGVVLGQFPSDVSGELDQFGAVMEEGNPLKACVDAAIEEITENGTLAEIEAEWLSSATNVPVIE